MARHVHTTPNAQPPKAAAYRSAPMPETALQMMMATAAWLDAKAAEHVRTSLQTRAELRTRAVVGLAAYRRAGA